jgi:hypothetical protein
VASSLERGCARCGQKCVPRRSGDKRRASLIWRMGAAIRRKRAIVDGRARGHADLLSIE